MKKQITRRKRTAGEIVRKNLEDCGYKFTSSNILLAGKVIPIHALISYALLDETKCH